MPAALFVVMTNRLSMPAGWPELMTTMFFGALGAAGALLPGLPSLKVRVGAQPKTTMSVVSEKAVILAAGIGTSWVSPSPIAMGEGWGVRATPSFAAALTRLALSASPASPAAAGEGDFRPYLATGLRAAASSRSASYTHSSMSPNPCSLFHVVAL